MCRTIVVSAWTYGENPEPYPGVESVEYEVPEKLETCTCWIGEEYANGKELLADFAERVLGPMFEKTRAGTIRIEML